MRRFAWLVAMIGALALVGTACSDNDIDGGGTTTATAAKAPDIPDSEFTDWTGQTEVTIEARDNVFVPRYVKLSPGTKVTFENRGGNIHNVIPAEKGAFSEVPSDEFGPDATAELTFDEVGDFPYYCSLHGTVAKGMTGAIRIVE